MDKNLITYYFSSYFSNLGRTIISNCSTDKNQLKNYEKFKKGLS